MLAHTYFHTNAATIYLMIMILLSLVVIIFIFTIIRYRKKMKRYRCVIVRLMNEKEGLLKELPPNKRLKYILPRKVTEEELLSLLMAIKQLWN